MNLVCRLVERALAASVATGDEPRAAWLRLHLDRCSACRQARADMEAIRNRLPEALDAPEPSDAFMERVWAGIDAAATASKPRRRAHLGVWAAAGACALAVVLAVPYLSDRTDRTDRIAVTGSEVGLGAQAGTRRTSDARQTAKAKPGAERRGPGRASAAQDAAIRRLILQRRRLAQTPAATESGAPSKGPGPRIAQSVPPAARGSAGASPSHTAADPKGASSARTAANPKGTSPSDTATAQTSVGWVDIARYYESQQDASSAAYAYRQALREKTDAGTAYAAGRTSEAAGDILTAVECLAEMLDAPPTASSSGDGVSRRPGERLSPEGARHCSLAQRARA